MSAQDDNRLVSEVLSGKISSFEILIDRYQKPIFNLIYKMTGDEEEAKDLTQDVFIRVFERLRRFNPKYKFFSWIYRIAINETINFLKARKQFERLSQRNELTDDNGRDNSKEEQRKILHAALGELRADQRGIIILKYFYGLSYDDICEVMELPEKKVKSKLFMAREKLRTILTGKNFFEHG